MTELDENKDFEKIKERILEVEVENFENEVEKACGIINSIFYEYGVQNNAEAQLYIQKKLCSIISDLQPKMPESIKHKIFERASKKLFEKVKEWCPYR